MGSFLSSWDQLCHWLKVQQKLDAVEGVYVLRADVQLLQMGLSEWPKNQMCFLWKTTWMNFTHSVNDILFYVNQGVFSEFRQAMREPYHASFQISEARVPEQVANLHWISEHPSLWNHTWLEYDFNHASNTSVEQNPRYVMTSRKPGAPFEVGKFRQTELEKQVASVHKSQAEALTPRKRLVEWCNRVKTILDEQCKKGERLFANQFCTLWTQLWPNDAIAWYKPDQQIHSHKILQALEHCADVIRCSPTELKWKAPPFDKASTKAYCENCGFDRDWRPLWTCDRCSLSVCVMCGRNSWDMKDRFQCEKCWHITPWKLSRGLASAVDVKNIPPWKAKAREKARPRLRRANIYLES